MVVIGQCTGNANNLLENVPWACQNICPKLSDHAFTHGGKLFSRVASFAFTAAISSVFSTRQAFGVMVQKRRFDKAAKTQCQQEKQKQKATQI
ncbi:hypothetical protein T12_11760 [Trichinella patagoniensis]|uniref:Uncharacterized protein n=1 Tax=Trichinella patagoniensis TaxID=990121 RepID=A0A0V1AGN3_9BILA|nr:hypothetical protein T12_11760 [Trichinella patagoniensis]